MSMCTFLFCFILFCVPVLNEFFDSHYILLIDNEQKSSKRKISNSVKYEKEKYVKVPKIYWKLTRKAVLTMEWIDGIKLTDEDALKKALLNRKELIDQVLGKLDYVICLFSFIMYVCLFCSNLRKSGFYCLAY